MHVSRKDTSQPAESYAYDENGNRTGSGLATGFYNRRAADETYTYEYDDEGNRIRRTARVGGQVTEYTWDHRNRLVGVQERPSADAPPAQTVAHRYDVFDRWISRAVDADGAGPSTALTTRYLHDADQIQLEFDDTGALTHRYLWGPAVDQLLADERLGSSLVGGAPGASEVLWPLPDQ